MYKIYALPAKDRTSISRGGRRVRRIPAIQIGRGAVLKIPPGRAEVISYRTLKENLSYLAQISDCIHIVNMDNNKVVDLSQNLKDEESTLPPPILPPEPLEEDEVLVSEETIPEIVEEKVEEVIEEKVEEVIEEKVEVISKPIVESKPKSKKTKVAANYRKKEKKRSRASRDR